MWASFEYFIRSVAPAAEEAGICLAVHPDDPPAASSAVWPGSSARRGAARAADFWPGPGFGIELCLGTVSEMGGQAAVLDAIGYLAPRGKIAYVHLRDVRGTVPSFAECFLGEGNYHPPTCCARCVAKGSTGSSSMITLPHWSATRPTATAAGPSPWVTSRG